VKRGHANVSDFRPLLTGKSDKAFPLLPKHKIVTPKKPFKATRIYAEFQILCREYRKLECSDPNLKI
jgi:hypothetical protein